MQESQNEYEELLNSEKELLRVEEDKERHRAINSSLYEDP